MQFWSKIEIAGPEFDFQINEHATVLRICENAKNRLFLIFISMQLFLILLWMLTHSPRKMLYVIYDIIDIFIEED